MAIRLMKLVKIREETAGRWTAEFELHVYIPIKLRIVMTAVVM